jgi:hypothetical protein
MNQAIWRRIIPYVLGVMAVIVFAWVLRWHALTTLGVGYDEDE